MKPVVDQMVLAVLIAINLFLQATNLEYGQYFCKGLYNRLGEKYPEDGIDRAELRFYGRMPGCDEAANPLRWEERRTYALHPQELCCDEHGDWSYCRM